MTIPAGTKFGPYHIVSLIGKGGMGEVYEGQDPRLFRKVAIKVLLPGLSTDQDRLLRFLQEARTVGALNHPNILSIYDVGIEEGSRYLVSELLDGETLRKRMAMGALSLSRSMEFAQEMAQGLSAAHEKGIVHRDLKPENVFVTKDGHIKILDFGIAKLVASGSNIPIADVPTAVKTETGVILGTVSYMSPEQVRGHSVDHRSDIFSLGIILYEMFTGTRPFQGSSAVEVMHSILREDPPDPSTIEPRVFPELSRVILHCLEKNCEERFQSVRDLAFGFRILSSAIQNPQYKSKKVSTAPVRMPEPYHGTSIAVLPFSDLSPDKNQDYFCDGIAEELLNGLSQVGGLQVASRTSAFQFRGTDQDIRVIGEKLNVGTVLEGSVRKSGTKLRITAQLVNVADGYHLWSEKYDREMADVFAIQDEIAGSIVSALKIKLVPESSPPLIKRHTANSEAYNLYLKGRFYLNQMIGHEYKRAAECFLKAIEKDSNYALAYAGLAECYVFGYLWLDPEEASEQARQSARRGVELDETIAEVHVSRGLVLLINDYDWPAADKEFQRALRLDPDHSIAHYWYACFLLAMGEFDSAIEQTRIAQSLDPLSPIVNTFLGRILSCAGRNDEAIEQFHKTLDLYPDLFLVHQWLAEAQELAGRDVEAFEECKEVLRLSGENAETISLMSSEFIEKGWNGFWKKRMDSLVEKSRSTYVSPFAIAEIAVRLEDQDRTFHWLNKAYREHSWGIVWMKAHPLFRKISLDPRFEELLKDLKLR